MRKVIVVGTGLAGLSLAYHLKKRGIRFLVFEKSKQIGGLASSKKLSNFIFDYSGHLLHFKNKKLFNFVRGFLGRDLIRHKRNSTIYFFQSFIPYPFQVNLFALPEKIKEKCLKDFIEAHNKRIEINNFYDWIMKNFGKGIGNYFMFPYNNKFWTVPLENLTYFWTNGLIPVPTVKEIIRRAERKINKDFGYNAFFWYPKRGISDISLALAKEVKNIFTQCEIKKIDLKNKKVRLANNSWEKYDYLFSSIPLPELPKLIKDMPQEILSLCKKLRWNSIFNINLGIDGEVKLPYHWIYFPEKRFSFYRVGFYHNFSSKIVPKGKSSIYIEISYSKFKPINKKEIISVAIKDLIKVGILKGEENILVKDINDIKYGYPIYDFNYEMARGKILDYLKEKNIISFGRYGSWRYMSMEDVLGEGEDIAMNL
ncbi:MAG: FAD-dependent oxidoreductase [Candidatus Omnitrophica bacterium]|nr:FAD-dependent oxidoreductase [Candidatus Omnitrophota bacterium]